MKSQLVTFIAIGAATAMLYFGVLYLILDVLHMPYKFSVSAAYCVSIMFHFTMNRRFTFRAEKKQAFGQAAKYLVVAGVNYLITLAVVTLCVEVLHLNAYIGVALSLFATTAFGFLAAKLWVFRNKVPQ